MNEIKSRSEANGNKIKYVDCTKVEHEVETQEITSQKNVIEGPRLLMNEEDNY